MKKRLFSILLTLCVALSLTPAMAFADAGGGSESGSVTVLTKDELESNYKVDETFKQGYALPSGNYKLGEDIRLSESAGGVMYVNRSADVTLDLAGFTLFGNDEQTAISIESYGSLTVKNSGGGNGKIVNQRSGVYLAPFSSFTLESGSIESQGFAIDIAHELVTVTLKGGTITGGSADKTIMGARNVLYANGGTVNGWVYYCVIKKDASASEGTTIYGKLTNSSCESGTCVVTFKNGDTQYANKVVSSGYSVSAPSITPTDPEGKGRPFLGWYTEPECENKYDFSTSVSSSITLYAGWNDTTAPVIEGIEDGKTYCDSVKFKVADNVGVASVEFNGASLTPDGDGYYTIEAGAGSGKVVAKDAAGNTASCSVTVNSDHTYQWESDDTDYWQECAICGATTTKKPLPSIALDICGEDSVCRTNDYTFSFKVPEGCGDPTGYVDLPNSASDDVTIAAENGVATVTVSAGCYGSNSDFEVTAVVVLNDGFPIEAKKDVQIVKHTDLQHVAAKAATQDSEGNIEYWRCEGCGKCFADKDAKTEIPYDSTVLNKLDEADDAEQQKPQKGEKLAITGDNTPAALLLVSLCAAGVLLTSVIAYGRRKKRSA